MNAKNLLLVIVAFTSLSATNPSAPALAPMGQWMIQDQSYQIRIFREGETLKARIVWVSDLLPQLDVENKDKSLRNRRVCGLIISSSIIYQEKSQTWLARDVYIPSMGDTYDCELSMESSSLMKAEHETLGGLVSISRQLRRLK